LGYRSSIELKNQLLGQNRELSIRQQTMKTVFIGGGRITSALLAGLRLTGYKQPLLVHDRNAHKLRSLKRDFKVGTEPDLARAVAQADLLIIAVRPQDVAGILSNIRAAISERPALKPPETVVGRRRAIACSLAAGIPLRNLRAALPSSFLWARAMPSPTSRFGRGLTAVAFEKTLPKAARSVVTRFFAHLGPVLEIAERHYDAFTVTYSTSYGYHALATLARAAEKAGLDRRTALSAAAHALADGILAWREGNLSLQELLQEAATPGGIAATVMNTMDARGYLQTVERGLQAGIIRARKNARK
jgi:pyrroline-5-carboxylate reductase